MIVVAEDRRGLAQAAFAAARPDDRRTPRVLSYAGRWGRARRWLPDDARRVLDVGSAFGYGTAALARGGHPDRRVVGVERDPAHLREAARRFPWLRVLPGDAADLPAEDAGVDAVVLLDVLEHVPDPAAVLAEAHRVLRPGGSLVLSVPHRGLLTRLDSLNVYRALQRRRAAWLPLDPADDCAGLHRHYTARELRSLLGGRYAVDRTARTGLGLTELFHLAILIAFKGVLRRAGVYRALLPVHLAIYLLDDLLPAGRAAYYLTLRARAVPAGEAR
jgi:SAM-dependent methyltransferase